MKRVFSIGAAIAAALAAAAAAVTAVIHFHKNNQAGGNTHG
nr:hypothetical protein [uncultured Oscillibacter sp.]